MSSGLGNPDNIYNGGGQHVPESKPEKVKDTRQKRAETAHNSAETLATPTKETVMEAASSGLPDSDSYIARKLLDPVLEKTGNPSGPAFMLNAAKEFKNMMETNPKAKDSVFFQAAYHYCNLFSRILGFSMTASMLSEYVDSFHSEITFKESELNTLVDNRKKTELLKVYSDTKKKLDKEPINSPDRAELEKTLKNTREELVKLLGPSGEYPDKLIEEFLAKNKEPVSKDKIEELNKKYEADSRISASYVYQQLGIPSYNQEYDSEVLMAQFDHTAYEEANSSGEKEKNELYTKVTSLGDFKTSLYTGAVSAGTVVFFTKSANEGSKAEKPLLMCGYVGIDGKIRYHDSTGLHTFEEGVNQSNLVDNLLERKSGNDKYSDLDVDDSALFGGNGGLFGKAGIGVISPFKMAFIPKNNKIYEETYVAEEPEKKEEAPQAQ